jgi:hypothetical protein
MFVCNQELHIFAEYYFVLYFKILRYEGKFIV